MKLIRVSKRVYYFFNAFGEVRVNGYKYSVEILFWSCYSGFDVS